jgi:hypothetical protein
LQDARHATAYAIPIGGIFIGRLKFDFDARARNIALATSFGS